MPSIRPCDVKQFILLHCSGGFFMFVEGVRPRGGKMKVRETFLGKLENLLVNA